MRGGATVENAGAVGSGARQMEFIKCHLSFPFGSVWSLVTENRELARILSASARTAQAKGLQRPNDH